MPRMAGGRFPAAPLALKATGRVKATAPNTALSATTVQLGDPADPTDPYIAAQAQALNHDPNLIFPFVRDKVAFQAYAGSVRGARGALWSMAGNSFDKSSLLVALLRASGLVAQYALGNTFLNGAAPQTLANQVPPNFPQVLGCPTTRGGNFLFSNDLVPHVWVQYGPAGGAPATDLDPSFPGSPAGQANATVAQTFTDIPQQYRQTLTLKETVETFSQASAVNPFISPLATTTVLQQTFETAALVGHPLSVYHRVAPAANGALFLSETSFTYTPLIIVGQGDADLSTNPVIQGQDFQEVYTNFPLGSTIVTGIFLEIDAPDNTGTVQAYTRTIFDRIGFAARMSTGQISVSTPATPAPVLTAVDIVTINALAGLQPQSSFQNEAARIQMPLAQLQPLLPQINALPTSGQLTADQLALVQKAQALSTFVVVAGNELVTMGFNAAADIAEKGLQAAYMASIYYNSPRLTLAVSKANPDGSFGVKLDLLKRDVRSVLAPGNHPNASMFLEELRGLWEASLEGPILQQVTGAPATDITAVFAASRAAGVEWTLLTPTTANKVESFNWSADGKARIAAALAAGMVVAAPSAELPVNGAPTLMWYQFNPKTGETISVSEDGGHQAILEYVVTLADAFGPTGPKIIGQVTGFGIGALAFAAATLNAVVGAVSNSLILSKNSLMAGSPNPPVCILNPPFPLPKPDVEPPLSMENLVELVKALSSEYLLKDAPLGILGGDNFGSILGLDLWDQFVAGFQQGVCIALDVLPAILAHDPPVLPILSHPMTGLPAAIPPGSQPGVNVSIAPDPLFNTLQFGNEELPQVFRASIQNTGPATDTFNLAGPFFGFVMSENQLTIPAGETGWVDICPMVGYGPDGSTLQFAEGVISATPGTPFNVSIQAQSATNPSIVGSASIPSSVPTMDVLSLGAIPALVSATPGQASSLTLTLTGSGNVSPGSVALTISAPPALTISGLQSPVNVVAGQVMSEALTITPAVGTPPNTAQNIAVTASYGTGQTASIPVDVLINSLSTCTRQAASLSISEGIAGLGSTLADLSQAMDALGLSPTSVNLQNRVQGEVLTAQSQFIASFLKQYQPQLGTAAGGISGTGPQVLAGLAALDQLFCTIDTTLQAANNHQFNAQLQNTAVDLFVSGSVIGDQLFLNNQSGVTREFQIALQGVPAGITASIVPRTVLLGPGAGTVVSVNFSPGPAVVNPATFSLTITPTDNPQYAQEIRGSVQERAQFLLIQDASVSPAYANPGTMVQVSATVFDALNNATTGAIFGSVNGPGSSFTVNTQISTTVNFAASVGLQTVTVGTIDTTGFAPGVYTVNLTSILSSIAGLVVNNNNNKVTTQFVVGKPLAASLTATPNTLPPPGGQTKMTFSLTRDLLVNNVSQLVGIGATSANPDNVAISGSHAYVCNNGAVDIFNISNPQAPVRVTTFGQTDFAANQNVAGCTVHGTTLIVGTSVNNASQPLHLLAYDITLPEQPVRLGTATTDINRVVASGTFPVFQGNIGISFTNLFEFSLLSGLVNQFGDVFAADFSNPAQPTFVGDLFPSGDARAGGPNMIFGIVSPASGTVYAASTTAAGTSASGTGRLLVVNTSNPAQMSLVTSVLVPGTNVLAGAAISGTTMLVTGNTGGITGNIQPGFTGKLTLTAMDISSPQAPQVKSTIATGYTSAASINNEGSSVLAIGNNLFIVGGLTNSASQSALLIVDATDPANLVFMESDIDAPTNVDLFNAALIYAHSADGLVILRQAQQSGPTINLEVDVPLTNVTVDPTSFSLAPSQTVAGSGFTRYLWNQPGQDVITWNETVTNLQPNYPVTVANGATVNFVEPNQFGAGQIVVPPVSVVANQIISISPTSVVVRPGETPATYQLSLTNPTASAVTYTFSVIGIPAAWIGPLPPLPVPANSTATTSLTITPALDAPAANDILTVLATASAGFSGAANAVLVVAPLDTSSPPVGPSHVALLSLNPAAVTIGRGDTVTTKLTAVDTGTGPEALIQSTNNNGAGISWMAIPNQFALEAGFDNARTLPLAVSASSTATPGTSTVSIAFQSADSFNPVTVNPVPLSVTVLSQGVGLSINPLSGGPSTPFTLTVTNNGLSTDTFNLAAVGGLSPAVNLAQPTITLAAGASGPVAVTLGALPPMLGNLNQFVITATSQANALATASVTVPITVLSFEGLVATINPSKVQVTQFNVPNTLLLAIQNAGNVDEIYNVSIGAVTGPVAGALLDPTGKAVQSISGIRVPAFSSAQLIMQGAMTAAGTGTITANVVSAINSSITAAPIATLTSAPTFTPPVANAGTGGTIPLNRVTVLDGSGSHDTNTPPLTLTYAWSLVSAPAGSTVSTATIQSASSVRATFVPDVAGTYVFKLTVTTAAGSNSASVTYNAQISPPVAVAGKAQNAKTCVYVLLDGKDSYDPSNERLTFLWHVESVPKGSQISDADLHNIATPRPFFKADIAGTYKFRLIVSNPTLSSPPDYVTVTVTCDHVPPNANAGYSVNSEVGKAATVDGSLSIDPENLPLTYSWVVMQVPSASAVTTASLAGANTAKAILVPDVPGTYQLQLTVSNGRASSSDEVTVNAYSGFSPPNAVTANEVDIQPGSSAVLDGSASYSPDNSTLSFAWTVVMQPAGSTAMILNANTATPAITPDLPGYYVVQLEVSDGLHVSDHNLLLLAAKLCDADGDGTASTIDLALIAQAEGSVALPNDPRDFDHDGHITRSDLKACMRRLEPPKMACNAKPNVLWPSNGQLDSVNIEVELPDRHGIPEDWSAGGLRHHDDGRAIKLLSITSNEPVAADDIQGFTVGTASTHGLLRASRQDSGTGRVYSFTYQGKDHMGNLATCITDVVVPHDRPHNTDENRCRRDEDSEKSAHTRGCRIRDD